MAIKFLYRAIAPTLIFLTLGGCLEEPTPITSLDGETESRGQEAQNRAPTIQGRPDVAVLTGNIYSFTPTASDLDGDTISFSIQNKPSWATFDTNTGRLTGLPLLGHEGVYTQISISVTDGTDTTSLPLFSIEVTQTADGSMTISWSAPSENSDGTTLTDLAGYYIYYGESPGNYPNRIHIDNPSVDTHLVENLLPDTYYVVATSYNSSGTESGYSGMAVMTVRSP